MRVLRREESFDAPPGRVAVSRRVALVCTPFQTITLPSLALGTLAPLLRQQGHHVDVMHLNLDLAARIGVGLHEELGAYDAWLRLLGEWLFADERVAPGALTERDYGAYLRAHRWRERAPALEHLDLAALRREASDAIDRWFHAHDWSSYDVVGFNVMFQQLNASLRLGARIKDASPGTRIILGGSAMEVPMGQPVLDRHDWLDAVFSGYAERTLPSYVATLPPRLHRVVTQETRVEMDELPVPDFSSFFEAVKATGLEGTAVFSVPIETSRGCWWGERNHCIFCGLNARDMAQRNKSGARVFTEVVEQSRHGKPFFATDNILPLEYFDGLFDRLIAEGVPFDTFYETKSNLRLAELRKLRRAGVSSLQPGIESLSTPILREMKKGVSAAQNIWFLRAAEELGFGVAWSILYGFPSESPAEYEAMAKLLPALAHLPPPLRPAPVLLERFSPLFERASSYGFSNLRPTDAHRAAFGAAPGLAERAYVFDFEYEDAREPDRYTKALNGAVSDWMAARARFPAPRCEVLRVGPLRLVLDSRARDRVGLALPSLHRLTSAECELVTLTREPIDERKLRAAWTSAEPVEEVLERFLARRWLLRSDGRLVRVLMCRDEPTVSAEVRRAALAGRQRGAHFLRRLRVRLSAWVRKRRQTVAV